MRLSGIFGFLSISLPLIAAAEHGHHWSRRHGEIAHRARGDVDIHKRAFSNSRFTFYDVGLGACGKYNSPGDFIVALNVHQYGGGYPGPQCFKSITISFGGKTAQATIMDECMGCPYGGLDFSRGLFDYFSSESAGVIYGDWWFNDGSGGGGGGNGGGGDPKTTSQWTPPKTSHHTWTPPSTTWSPPPQTSTSSQAPSTTTLLSLNLNTGPISGLIVPTGSVVITTSSGSKGSENLLNINQAVIGMAALVASGEHSN
ncbi:plant expansin [Hygrophoropsis aurantiaca]|uniref:Plant expansin n=1 Tax=Hygrophoropsis aurantiaca TaxID=72124 RepID=A0ACB8AGS1_9AGAM|nr:plant expansin [Hygrophoropsis aurantiaca]